MARTFKQVTYEQRLKIKEMLDAGAPIKYIAETVGVHPSTIYREQKRGITNGSYDPDLSEEHKQEFLALKGPEATLSANPKLAQIIADYILKDHYSPKKIASIIKSQPDKFPNCTITHTTIYSAIDNGLIPGVTRESLQSIETTVFTDGHIILAKWIRDKLDIKDGDVLHFEVTDDNKIIFSKDEKDG